MPDILIASDASWVRDEVGSVLTGPDTNVHAVATGAQVRPAFTAVDPDLVILDLQIGSMGGLAICYDLRLEDGRRAGPSTAKVLILLDRRADVFLARRSKRRRLAPQAARSHPPAAGRQGAARRRDATTTAPTCPSRFSSSSASDTLGGNGK